MTLAGVLKSAYSKPLLHSVCLLPFAALIWALLNNRLGANPVEALTHETGEWGLRMLLLTLTITPLCRWTGTAAWVRFRRMLGLYVFFYISCHFLIWLVFDHSMDLDGMIEDIIKRPYITVGFAAFILLVPLAVTSNQLSVRKLGRRWRTLHKLVYLIVLLGILHFLWLVKADYLEPAIYAIITAILLLYRVISSRQHGSKSSALAR